MVEVALASVLVESVTERLKDLGLTGYSALLSLGVAIVVAVAANVQVVPIDLIQEPVVNQIISGIIISGGSNYVNSVRDKLRR